MEFRVLGPLEVRHAGMPLGGPRQRAVLAALLLRANDVLTARHLAETVWERPPGRPESNIRTYVSGLRQRLHQAGADGSRLVTGAGGYPTRQLPGVVDHLPAGTDPPAHLADPRGEANTLHSLGYAHQHLGDH